jgi:DNA-binding response OmpR family regulator
MSVVAGEKLTLLIVDDDVKFCHLIASYLSGFGYEVHSVHNGLDGIRIVSEKVFQAIILDVMLPGVDGFHVLKKIRENSDAPVLMLTGLGDEADRVVGLELGADDYIPKTSSSRELLARLRAVLRRSARSAAEIEGPPAEIVIGALSINLSARMVTLDGERLQLTPVEFDLLAVLAQSRGRVKTREQLIEAVNDETFDVSDRSIDVHISGLRKKLNDDAKNPRFIQTLRTAGYMFIYELIM